jgi:hypothetical protein
MGQPGPGPGPGPVASRPNYEAMGRPILINVYGSAGPLGTPGPTRNSTGIQKKSALCTYFQSALSYYIFSVTTVVLHRRELSPSISVAYMFLNMIIY